MPQWTAYPTRVKGVLAYSNVWMTGSGKPRALNSALSGAMPTVSGAVRRAETRCLVPATTGLSGWGAPKEFSSGVVRSLRTMACGTNLGHQESPQHSQARSSIKGGGEGLKEKGERHAAGLGATGEPEHLSLVVGCPSPGRRILVNKPSTWRQTGWLLPSQSGARSAQRPLDGASSLLVEDLPWITSPPWCSGGPTGR